MSEDDFVKLENVAVTYGRKAESSVTALDETNLRIGEGDFIALVGPSGCGKSTILKLVGGLIPASRGYVYCRGSRARRRADPHRHRFPEPDHAAVAEDPRQCDAAAEIVPPFRGEYRAKKNSEFKDRAEALLAQVGLKGFGDKYPGSSPAGCCSAPRLPRAGARPATPAARRAVRRARSVHREELWRSCKSCGCRGSRPSFW